MVTKIGLDLGYANITLSDVSMGIYREPSIALINKETRRIVSVGSKALLGGENGTLIVTGKFEKNGDGKHRMFVSFDYGRTWDTMENPLPYDLENDALSTNRIGHSAAFFVGSDPSVIYYMNTTDIPETGRQRIQFARLKIN
jgi:hypothetical protein